MNTIYKYELETTDEQVIEMPEGALILTAQMQHGRPCLWARVNPEAKRAPRTILTYGTGHSISEVIDIYIGTYQLQEGDLVFHVFEKLGGVIPV